MPSTTTYRRGQVVVVNVPYSDQSGAKPRPALVVSAEGFHRNLPDLIVCPVSSQPKYYERPGPGDRPLRHWQAVRLRHPSTVRVSNIVAVDKSIVTRVLGSIETKDLEAVTKDLRHAVGL